MKKILLRTTVALLLSASAVIQAAAQEKPESSAQELADKLANPVASMISFPLQNNADWGIGPYNGSKYTLNIQPVIPFKLSKSVNLITRYILPVVDQYDVSGEGNHEFGLSDASVSAFFSPSKPSKLIWGVGPAFLVPTGTENFLSTRKWGAGPTLLALHQSKGLTAGFLANQIWSFAGDEDRGQVNQLFIQPFITHNWQSGAGFGVNAEITANWAGKETTAFINPVFSGLTKFGKQPVQLAVGPRIPVAGPSHSKANFGLRGVIIFVFAE
ncbi:hypothetical protein [Chitinophaga barathri]|uniref:Transporter n=1 Tax=Chitinophaga barathri TaxID=1647451 RepID=A0A3N4MC38_9BACT|nr:hypothetical protein [Chitinophaga barathri]RPD39017.1 hypothetical protein EG028_23050 [Chitinophaga barathri]